MMLPKKKKKCRGGDEAKQWSSCAAICDLLSLISDLSFHIQLGCGPVVGVVLVRCIMLLIFNNSGSATGSAMDWHFTNSPAFRANLV